MDLRLEICKNVHITNLNKEINNISANTDNKQSGKESIKDQYSIISCIDWYNNEEVYFVFNNCEIYKWNALNDDTALVAKLPLDFIATDLHWLLLSRKSIEAKNSDSLLISSNDGRFLLLNKNARAEKIVSAHSTAISAARWSPDGAGLLTAGVDGVIKIWSRLGMLRSTVVQGNEPITCARWSRTSTAIVFSHANYLAVKPLAANTRLLRWHAHKGMVLSLCWSLQTDIIASGGEDYLYKLWTPQGVNLYTSSREEDTITSLSFNPEREILVVGTFNILKLCANVGWCYGDTYFNEPIVGSFIVLSWSTDGTQIACATSTGRLIIGYILQTNFISRNLKVLATGRRSLHFENLSNASNDMLDYSQPIINLALGYGHLVVATSHQVHVYNEKYLNTPNIIEGRSNIRLIQLAKKYFMVADCTNIWIYTYQGRLHSQPRYPGLQLQVSYLNQQTLSLGANCLAIRDHSDTKNIHIFNVLSGTKLNSELQTLSTKNTLIAVAACRSGNVNDQFVVMIDANGDLYIIENNSLSERSRDNIKSASTINDNAEIYKIGTQVTSVKWASETNILVGLHDTFYSIWYCPGEGCTDSTVISLTTISVDISDLGEHIVIKSFEDHIITFQCSGALVHASINIHGEMLHRMLNSDQWTQAIRICRWARNTCLWATLAAIASRKNQLQICEDAYAAALQIDKVSYLRHIKTLDTSSAEYMAEIALLRGRLPEAITILLHSQEYRKAINICFRMHNWYKAIEIAQKYQNDLISLIADERRKYLKALNQTEMDPKLKETLNIETKQSNEE